MFLCQPFEFGLDLGIQNYEIMVIPGVMLTPNFSTLVMTFCARNMKHIDYGDLQFTV